MVTDRATAATVSTLLPHTLIYLTALTCGVLAALALLIYLDQAGYGLIGLWGNLFSSEALQLRTAGPWSATAGLAFVVSGATAAALARLPLPWSQFRVFRWATATVILFVLAHVGHLAAAPADVSAGANLAATLAALGLAAVMAGFGAYFTVPR